MPGTSDDVTLLFTDIEGSTRLWEHEPEAMKLALERHDVLVRGAIEASGGRVFKTAGDGFCAVFLDPVDGLLGAVSAQRALFDEAWQVSTPIRARMALHSGACLQREDDYFGPTVNRAARLMSIGYGGQLLLSQSTCDLVAARLPDQLSLRDLGEHRLKDLSGPERVYQVCGPGLAVDFGSLRSLENPTLLHNLPVQTSSFVGRTRELADLSALLLADETRLVTLTGPGGVGKSRLALQAAADVLSGNGDGVWLVELAPLTAEGHVPRAVGAAIGVREEAGRSMSESLVEAIGDRYLLLVLDNCEHVLESIAKLADLLLRSCSRVQILATSREPLGIGGERVYRVPSLRAPVSVSQPAELVDYEAVELFVERAVAHRSDFVLDDASAKTVAEVCARLDGIPLAIELAAARVRSLSVAEINDRLDQRFRLLTGGDRAALPRQRTLRALIDWSYDLLSPHDQLVLDRLGTFAGGWTLEAAERVVAGRGIDRWEVIDRLGALVDKSLISASEQAGATRYSLLETVREYAAERLAAQGDAEVRAQRAAHRDYYLELAERASAAMHGPDEVGWLDQLEIEHDNLRVALAVCQEQPGGIEHGLRFAVALREFWAGRGYPGEGVSTIQALLDRPGAGDHSALRAGALNSASFLSAYLGDHDAAARYAREAYEIACTLDNSGIVAAALYNLTWFFIHRGDLDEALRTAEEGLQHARDSVQPHLTARALTARAVVRGEMGDVAAAKGDYDEAIVVARDVGDQGAIAATLDNLAVDEIAAGDLPAARTHLAEALEAARHVGDKAGVITISLNLGLVDVAAGEHQHARTRFLSTLQDALRIGHHRMVPHMLLGLALTESAEERTELACILHGAADELAERTGRTYESLESGLRDRDVQALREHLGAVAFEEAYRRGRALGVGEVIAMVSAEPEQTSA